MSICVNIFSFLLGKCLRMGLLSYMIGIYLTLLETISTSSKQLYHFTFPPAINESCCFTSSPKLVSLLNFGLSSDYLIACHESLEISFMTNDIKHLSVFSIRSVLKFLLKIFLPVLKIRLFVVSYYWIVSVCVYVCTQWIQDLHQLHDMFCKYFPNLGLASSSYLHCLLMNQSAKILGCQIYHFLVL